MGGVKAGGPGEQDQPVQAQGHGPHGQAWEELPSTGLGRGGTGGHFIRKPLQPPGGRRQMAAETELAGDWTCPWLRGRKEEPTDVEPLSEMRNRCREWWPILSEMEVRGVGSPGPGSEPRSRWWLK